MGVVVHVVCGRSVVFDLFFWLVVVFVVVGVLAF